MGSILSEFALKHHLNLGKTGAHARLSHDQLALRIRSTGSLAPGVSYAQRGLHENGEKVAARARLLQAYRPGRFGGRLNILTMPGISWEFERELLRRRSNQRYSNTRKASNAQYLRGGTRLFAIESNEAIYRGSIVAMPGSEWVIRHKPDGGVSSPLVKSYRRVSFDELAKDTRTWDDKYFEFDGVYDAAWLDFNGPITLATWEALSSFWLHRIRWSLALTFMGARQGRNTSEAIKTANGWIPWIHSQLPGAMLMDAHRYSTGHVPMIQLIFEKPTHRDVTEFWSGEL